MHARRQRDLGGLVPGLIMIAVGTAFLLERFDYISMRQVWRLWPVIVICIGVVHVVRPDRGRPSIFLLLVGIWLQISTLELWGLDFGESWPLLIIFVGVSFVFDALVSVFGRPSTATGSITPQSGTRPAEGGGRVPARDGGTASVGGGGGDAALSDGEPATSTDHREGPDEL